MQPGATHPSASDSTTAVARKQIWAALLLAWVAAFSDAIGFLVLQQLGASFMSGNSMSTGVALGRLDWASVLQRGLPILVFLGVFAYPPETSTPFRGDMQKIPYTEEVLSRALYARQCTRHLDRHGYLKFKHCLSFGATG
jgi:hypothetical protein